MTDKSNNPPDVVLELTQEEADFLYDNCEANMVMGLEMIQKLGNSDMTNDQIRPTAEKLSKTIDSFKAIRDKLKKAIR